MVTTQIDGSVRNREYAQELLDAMVPLLPSGAVVRVTRKTIRVDMSRVSEYDKRTAETERVGEAAAPGGLP